MRKLLTDEKKLFANIEKQMEAEGIHVPNFIRNRIAAQKRIPLRRGQKSERNLSCTFHYDSGGRSADGENKRN